MNVAVFIVGAVVASFYVYFLFLNIFNQKKDQDINGKRRQIQNDPFDLDGMGDFSRFPSEK